MAIRLDQVIPWGRSLREYELMFALSREDLVRGVLDCGGGPASFTAEATAAGHRVVSVDPLYCHPGSEIRKRFDAVAQLMLDQVRASPDDWTWTFHANPDELLASRRVALDLFLADYPKGVGSRYLAGELPALPLRNSSFGLALCSHLLFLYSDLLDEAFHILSVAELCRLAEEVRIYPVITLAGKPSPHIAAVRSAVAAEGWVSEIVRVDYELQRGGNQMMRVCRPERTHHQG
jgi:hypothetical protein